MPSPGAVIAVDWGTTNRRAYALDARGSETGRLRDERGVLAVGQGGFAAAARDLREQLGDLPLLLAGMIGSNRGWIEAPYLACPVDLNRLAKAVVAVPDEDASIVPGLSCETDGRYDVMRGEEVQLLGAVAAGLAPPDGLICHPGTHAKWARMERGSIRSFRTVMTGELFALLKTHSILAPQLAAPAIVSQAFAEGVDLSLAGGTLTADLFSVRARGLLTGLESADASALVSGLLIGADVRTGLSDSVDTEMVTLVGEPKLTRLYAAALERAGRASTQIDGETAFLGGIHALLDRTT